MMFRSSFEFGSDVDGISGGTKVSANEVNALKVDLLNCVEQLRAISNSIEACKNSVNSNLTGVGKSEILSKFDLITEQIPIVDANINTYSAALGKVVDAYVQQDAELSTRLMHDIDKEK